MLVAAPFLPASAATFGAAVLSYDAALLSQFNLINFGNLNTTNSGVSGRVVVGGNYTTTGGSTDCYATTCTGNTTAGVDANGNPTNSSGANGYGAVTVFGNIVGGLSNANGGDIDVKGSVSGNTFNLNSKGGLNLGGASSSSTVANGATEVRTTQTNPQGQAPNQTAGFTVQTGDTMAQVFAPFGNANTLSSTFSNPLINLSRGIAALPGTPGVKPEALPASNATFFTAATDYTYNGYKYGVVTTTMANLALQSSKFTGVANGAGDAATFVIITGDTGDLLPTLNYNDPKVIYNFVGATTLKFNGAWTGSILAPLATITQQGGALNGSIVVAAFNQTKELLSSDSFTGDLGGLTGVQFSAVPEPASLLLFGAGAAATAGSAAAASRRAYATRLPGLRPASTASIPSSTRFPIAARVSTVALPKCGSSTTFSSAKYREAPRGSSL